MRPNLFTFFLDDLKHEDEDNSFERVAEILEVPRTMVGQWKSGHRRIGPSYWRIFDNPLVSNHRFRATKELKSFCKANGLPAPEKLQLTLGDYLRSAEASDQRVAPPKRKSNGKSDPAKRRRKAVHIA